MVEMVVLHQPVDRERPDPELRHPSAEDGPALWELARTSGLDVNSPYAYALWGEYFAATSVVAVEGPEVIGFISGFRIPSDGATIFVWQVAVATGHRQRGIGQRMLDWLVERSGARAVDATVTLTNSASIALFRSLAARHGTAINVELLFGSDLLPGGHEPEFRFHVPVGTEPT